MIVIVTTDDEKVIWKSGEPMRQGKDMGICCDKDDLHSVIDELQSATCQASTLLASLDEGYRVLDACRAAAKV